MSTALLPAIKSLGYELETDSTTWRELTETSLDFTDPAALMEQMNEDGYIFIRDFFPQDLISEARMSMLEKLAAQGIFVPGYPLMEARLKDGVNPGFSPKEAMASEEVKRVVFGPEITGFCESFLGGPIRHFDFIWARTKGRSHGAKPHCDIVYMGRGTHQLYTAWIPYGRVTYDIGGLMILEGSHRKADRIRKYLESDVDTYCENVPGRDGWKFSGSLSNNPFSLREKLGGRWLSAEYNMGDLLMFRMDTVHGSLDNQTDYLRLSTDTRYQLASEPIDERWVGENPIAHSAAGKRGRIC